MKVNKTIRIGILAFIATIFIIPQSSLALAQVEITPAPPSIGADVPLTYFGPSPSQVQRELVGPVQLLRSGKIDMATATITLPLYIGKVKLDGGKEQNVWYILTDTTDKGNADALGLNYSPKLNYVAEGARTGMLGPNNTLVFNGGTVDFSPKHELMPGNTSKPFPPTVAKPGSVGDKDYTPLVRIENSGGNIYNAPVIASNVSAKEISFCDGNPDYSKVHDKVVKICPEKGTVTLKQSTGFSFAKPVFYLSTDANSPMVAAMENATLAPRLKNTVTVGHDDGAFSAVERLFAIVNGPTGKDNPQRQGFNSALIDGGGPLNTFGGIPTVATDYSPLWDVNVGEWTQKAIDSGYRSRVIEEFQILGLVKQGWITGPDGNPFGSSGLVIDCPVTFRFL